MFTFFDYLNMYTEQKKAKNCRGTNTFLQHLSVIHIKNIKTHFSSIILVSYVICIMSPYG